MVCCALWAQCENISVLSDCEHFYWDSVKDKIYLHGILCYE